MRATADNEQAVPAERTRGRYIDGRIDEPHSHRGHVQVLGMARPAVIGEAASAEPSP
ncbi:hypothetical protein ACFQ6N_04655 [Kitasatospora sp. NPDC056446]|uniref:hypothetical protein n=1 Tax=Kitasatospora sp. NPDC056446 TaxID=3345819 RepID=UPI00367AE4DC